MNIVNQIDWDTEAELRTEEALRLQVNKKIVLVDLTDLPDRKTLPTGLLLMPKLAASLPEQLEEAPEEVSDTLVCVDCEKDFPRSERRGRSLRCPTCLDAPELDEPKPLFHTKHCLDCHVEFQVPRTAGQHLRKWCDLCTEKRREAAPAERAGTWTKTCECGATFEASGKGAHFAKLCPTCKQKRKTDLGEDILAPCMTCQKLFPRKLREKQNYCEEHRK